MPALDKFIIRFDHALRTLFAPAVSTRPSPAMTATDAELTADEKSLATKLMRVNHSGEICAQALYEGQAVAARSAQTTALFETAAREETEHLAWCEKRIKELNGRTSLLNPLLYGGSFAIGVLAGGLGDKWNLGFLAETERQVERHLAKHLERLPSRDQKSRAILYQMKIDEGRHASNAEHQGAHPLPKPIRLLMTLSSKAMTKTTFWI